MRPYRGKRKDNGKWVKGSLVEYTFLGELICSIVDNKCDLHPGTILPLARRMCAVDPETVGQPTGMKDEKRTKKCPEGQDIYEGDFGQSGTEEKYLDLCEWDEDTCAFMWVSMPDRETVEYINEYPVTIVGNKWDSPELLEEAKP